MVGTIIIDHFIFIFIHQKGSSPDGAIGPVCVCLSVRTVTFEQNDLWPGYLAFWFIWVVGQSSRTQEANVTIVVGATSSDGFQLSPALKRLKVMYGLTKLSVRSLVPVHGCTCECPVTNAAIGCELIACGRRVNHSRQSFSAVTNLRRRSINVRDAIDAELTSHYARHPRDRPTWLLAGSHRFTRRSPTTSGLAVCGSSKTSDELLRVCVL